MERPFNVLFLCTGNSARSIMAEAILNREGHGNFRAFSAGSQPKGQPHPYTLDLLRKLNFDVSGLRSKSWNEFSGPGAMPLDFILTVCDNAAGESCPFWPGQPMTAHWGVPDPAAATGNEAQVRQAFAERPSPQEVGVVGRSDVEIREDDVAHGGMVAPRGLRRCAAGYGRAR